MYHLLLMKRKSLSEEHDANRIGVFWQNSTGGIRFCNIV
jgi:hypothetical protein